MFAPRIISVTRPNGALRWHRPWGDCSSIVSSASDNRTFNCVCMIEFWNLNVVISAGISDMLVCSVILAIYMCVSIYLSIYIYIFFFFLNQAMFPVVCLSFLLAVAFEQESNVICTKFPRCVVYRWGQYLGIGLIGYCLLEGFHKRCSCFSWLSLEAEFFRIELKLQFYNTC